MRGDDLHGRGVRDHAAQALGQAGELRVGGDALFEVAGLADIERLALGIEHAVHAGIAGHGFQRGLDDGHAGGCWNVIHVHCEAPVDKFVEDGQRDSLGGGVRQTSIDRNKVDEWQLTC